eukprot:scaffold90879_cov46-Tisochrysis_lutea.AAC.1
MHMRSILVCIVFASLVKPPPLLPAFTSLFAPINPSSRMVSRSISPPALPYVSPPRLVLVSFEVSSTQL